MSASNNNKEQEQQADLQFRSEVFRFGKVPLIIFLTFLNAFVPISVDLYLPALPHMKDVFNCSEALASYTLSAFMLFFAVSMLLWGALSDRFGRKKILNMGFIAYMLGSVVCILATNIYLLIGGRILQAIGSGAVCSISMAIVKDTFKGKIMENVLVWIQAMTVLCPMLAPILGAFLLRHTSWRGLFIVLLCCSVCAFLVSIFLKETLKNPTQGAVLATFGRIGVVLQNRGLRWLLVLFSISLMPFMAYLTSSSFIYIGLYGLNPEEFGLFFAGNACGAMLGPMLYMRVFRRLNRSFYLCSVFGIMIASGAALWFFGTRSPFHFLFLYLPITVFASSSRPLGTLLMMSQLDSDNGTVASLIGSSGLLCGSLSMVISSQGFSNPVMPVAVMGMVIGTACLLIWLLLDKKKLYREPYAS